MKFVPDALGCSGAPILCWSNLSRACLSDPCPNFCAFGGCFFGWQIEDGSLSDRMGSAACFFNRWPVRPDHRFQKSAAGAIAGLVFLGAFGFARG